MTIRKLTAIIATGFSLILIAGLAGLVLRPADTFAASTESGNTNIPFSLALPTTAAEPTQPVSFQATNAYRQQAQQINQLLQARKATYQTQLTELTQRVQTGRTEIENLAKQQNAMQQQLAALEAARSQRLAQYQQQLATTKQEYAQRFDQYNAQIQQAQAKLAEANAILGR